MSKINESGSINYTKWQNSNALKFAEQADDDKIKGLNRAIEIFNLVKFALESKVQKADLNELFNTEVPSARTRAALNSREISTEFQKAIDYYNTVMGSYQKYNITQDTYLALEKVLSEMEQGINEAFNNCKAYSEILITPSWYYRFYPYLMNHLDSFDIEEIRTKTSESMESLQNLKQEVEDIIAKAGGKEKGDTVERTSYDIEALAVKHLGMSYKDFAKNNRSIIEKCKTMTLAGMASLTPSEADAYSRLQAYAKEMIEITVQEAHTVRWNAGDRKVEETLKATGDMYKISEFEYDGISEQGLNELESDIMYNTFKKTLIDAYNKINPDGMDEVSANKRKDVWKEPDGKGGLTIHIREQDFDLHGRRRK